MSKLSNMLRMILILSKRDNVKISELATTLEVSNRQIRRYRDELEFSGIFIESMTGKDGGYSLQDKSDVFQISKSITEDEERLVQLLSQDNYGDIRVLYNMLKQFYNESNMPYLEHIIPDHKALYASLFIYDAKEKKKVVKVEYTFDQKNNLTFEKTIHPYITFRKYGQQYVYAYDEYNEKMIKLLLSKFKSWEITGDSFDVKQELYDSAKREVRESSSVFSSENEYIVEANVWSIELAVLERVLECTVEVKHKSGTFSSIRFKSRNLSETKRKLMMFGSNIAVFKPVELKQLILRETEKIKKRYEKKHFSDEYGDYVKQVEKHMRRYVRHHYGHIPYGHVMSKICPVHETFLTRNRNLFLQYKDETGELHSPRNFKSSQMMALDYFLQYKEKDLATLSDLLHISDDISSIMFEKEYPDYTHADVVLELETGGEVLIECKYTESKFDRLSFPKEEHYDKYYGRGVSTGIVRYQDINKFMTKQKVTDCEFFIDYQLFRNLYNAFANDKLGYLVVLIPKSNPNVNKQFDQFYYNLIHKYGFMYSERVRKVYWDILAQDDIEFLGKYIYIKNSRINLLITSIHNKLLSDTPRNHPMIELSSLDEESRNNYINQILDSTKHSHDVLDSSIREFKKYDELLDLKIYSNE